MVLLNGFYTLSFGPLFSRHPVYGDVLALFNNFTNTFTKIDVIFRHFFITVDISDMSFKCLQNPINVNITQTPSSLRKTDKLRI